MKTTNENRQQSLADRVFVVICLSATFGLAGCQQDGAAEKAGKKIDSAAENAEQKYDLATARADQKIKEAKELLDQKADKAGEYINESTDASKGALEKAGKKIDQATEKAGQELEGAKKSVINKAETAGEYIDDSVITTAVKAAILNEPLLSASHIDVTTAKGVVKLSGKVDSEPSIGRAMEVVNSQKHVKSVEVDLVVNASPSK
ncbi:MAG: BON domain-containing protein [Methylobacter sp.]|uniref:BON domain-containing protein n=1 Tax=Methylobacter sp. TaxID=2051955 RepID=UPI0025EBB1FA|nr:BON domain-containing protein [Methylobacter sp.]MCK9619110.1 BON domain-containing protein [Methylobacter sp.]